MSIEAAVCDGPLSSPLMRLIVVGAGVAGLTVANAASCAGAEVIVLEARGRIGGRTWTVPFGPGVVDLGGSWVEGPVGNPIAEALGAAGIATRNDGPSFSRMAVWADGWVDAPDATTLTAAIADWDPAEALGGLRGSDRFVDGVDWFLADRELDGRAGVLARFGLLWVDGAVVSAAPPERISLAGLVAFQEGGGGNLVPTGGYGVLVKQLSAGLDVRLGAPVCRVEHGGSEVVVQADGGTFEGDRVVVSVPLGVLGDGSLAFDPPLGDAHRQAVERLEMGTLEKILLRFPTRFWPDSVAQITHVDDDLAFPLWLDFSRHVGSPTLVAFYNPAVTPGLANRPAQQRIGPALEILRKMFGSVPDPDEVIATDWVNDQWARGSYSYLPLGATADEMLRLGEPVSDRLILAGEATVPEFYGTVHGAFRSGLRAAEHVLGERPKQLTLGAVAPHWLA